MQDTLQYIQSDHPWFFSSIAFILGAMVGSFLNVCIYRIPAGKSVVSPGSACACGTPIAWYDNIPVLSWFILRGKARCCGRPYSFRYPFIELLTAGLFLAAWSTQSPAKAACLMILISMLICGSFIDFDHMEIPNRFSVGLAIVGVGLSLIAPSLHLADTGSHLVSSIHSGYASVLGVLIGSGVILWIALIAETVLRKEAMGFGDVKLMGGIGAFLGWQGAVFAIFGGAMIGCVGLLVWLVAQKCIPSLRPAPQTEESTKSESDDPDEALMKRAVPFGPMLSAGALVYALLLESQVDAYFAEMASLFQ